MALNGIRTRRRPRRVAIEDLLDRVTLWHVMAASLVGALIVSGCVFLLAPATYTASTSLLLTERPDVVTSLGAAVGSTGNAAGVRSDAATLDVLVTILGSRQMRERIVEELALTDRLGLDDPRKAVDELADMTRIKLNGDIGLSVTVSTGGSRAQIGTRIGSALRPPEARSLSAGIANLYLKELEAHVTEGSVREARQVRQFIEQRRAELEKELRETELALQDLQTKHRLIDPQGKASQLADESKAITQALSNAKAERESLEKSLTTARRQLVGIDPTRIAQEVSSRNPVISDLEQKLAQLQVNVATERAAGKTAEHPDIVALQASIEGTRAEIAAAKEEVRTQVTQAANPEFDSALGKVVSMEVDLSGARAREAQYVAMLSAVQSQIAQLPAVQRDYVSLKRDQDLRTQLLTTLAQQLELAAIEETKTASGKFHVLDRAAPPLRRSGPPTALAGLGSFVGLAVLLWTVTASRRGLVRMFGGR